MAPRTKALWIIEQHNGSAKHAMVTAEVVKKQTNEVCNGLERSQNENYWNEVIFFIKQRIN